MINQTKAAKGAVILALALHALVLILAGVWLIIAGLGYVAIVALGWLSIHTALSGALGYVTGRESSKAGGLL